MEKKLTADDICLKFFWDKPINTESMCSVRYEEEKEFDSGNDDWKLSFFTKKDAMKSLKTLHYLMDFGDYIAVIENNEKLLSEAVEESAGFCAKHLKIEKVYSLNSTYAADLIIEWFRTATDYGSNWFQSVIIDLLKVGAWDTANTVYSIISLEKKIILSERQLQTMMQLGTNNLEYRQYISLTDIEECYDDWNKFIELVKEKVKL